MAGPQYPPKPPVIAPQMRGRAPARPVGPHPAKGIDGSIATASPGQARAAAREAQPGQPGQPGQLKVITNEVPLLKPGGDPKDRELAARVLKAQHLLQEAMDAAVLAGLIIEPAFTSFPNRFKELGNDKDSFVAKIEIYRRLA